MNDEERKEFVDKITIDSSSQEGKEELVEILKDIDENGYDQEMDDLLFGKPAWYTYLNPFHVANKLFQKAEDKRLNRAFNHENEYECERIITHGIGYADWSMLIGNSKRLTKTFLNLDPNLDIHRGLEKKPKFFSWLYSFILSCFIYINIPIYKLYRWFFQKDVSA